MFGDSAIFIWNNKNKILKYSTFLKYNLYTVVV